MSAVPNTPASNPAGSHALRLAEGPFDASRPGLPATGVVLIGSPSAVRTMAAHLASLRPVCIPVGCVLTARLSELTHHADEATALGLLPPTLGFTDELIDLHARYRFKLALVSLPSDGSAEERRLRGLLRTLQVPTRWVPTVEDLVVGRAGAGRGPTAGPTAEVDPAALIGRTHSGLDRRAVGAIITGQRVLVTGAGGSIGSELCRVAAGFAPSELIMLERAENALFQIDQAMARRFPGVPRRAVLHDVVDAGATAALIGRLKPDVVFHAAAHKHVPLMEDHPAHAVNNNLLGTKSIADACLLAKVRRFVMISSDKAVNPTSVMGATKRLAEMYVQHLAGVEASRGRTRMSMVRFGNVLASACSVIPIWAQQLAEGHPITVTDPRMTRYFMTIPEAATLVVQAAALDQPAGVAPVYVLDMGEPIRILDLAVRFARLNGLEPRPDPTSLARLPEAARDAAACVESDDAPDAAIADIVFTGARPGEKLHEELAYSAEKLAPTAHPAIGQWTAEGSAVDARSVETMVREMIPLSVPDADKARVVEAIRRHVPEMARG